MTILLLEESGIDDVVAKLAEEEVPIVEVIMFQEIGKQDQ